MAPRALTGKAVLRWMRAVNTVDDARDRPAGTPLRRQPVTGQQAPGLDQLLDALLNGLPRAAGSR